MNFKALMARYGRFALLVVSAALISACANKSTKPAEPAPAEEAFKPQSGSIEPTPAVTSAHSDTPDAPKVRLADNHPRKYIVKKGDTLWDIANLFLQDPWYWPEIWQRNPQVENPHLIYPGDELTLTYINGQPQIQLSRNGAVTRYEGTDVNGRKVVRLSPKIHRQTLDEAIPNIPADAVRQFLTRPRVVSDAEWEKAPYIVGSDDAHLVLGANNKVYIRGELDKERNHYSVFREGKRLEDPDTGETLGHEIIYAAEISIKKYANPSSGVLLKTTREVLIGDRLLPTDKGAIDQQYFPHIPKNRINGTIISLFDAISSIAKYQIAVINRGRDAKLEVGHLLATYQKGELAKDKFMDKSSMDRDTEDRLDILLPDERSGLMMIFKVFDRVSYGLILKSTRRISKLDKVDKPIN